jgi:hypothetical protein
MANFTELTDDQLELVTGGVTAPSLGNLATSAANILGAAKVPSKAQSYVTNAASLTQAAGQNAPTAPNGSLSDIFGSSGLGGLFGIPSA